MVVGVIPCFEQKLREISRWRSEAADIGDEDWPLHCRETCYVAVWLAGCDKPKRGTSNQNLRALIGPCHLDVL